MTLGVAIRSILALLAGVLIAALTLTHASIPPASALQSALGASSGDPKIKSLITGLIPAPTPTPRPGAATPVASGTPAPTATPIVVNPGFQYAGFPYIPGHIFYDDPHHNLFFITQHAVRTQFTGDSTTVSPALSQDGSRLAFVQFLRNSSDIFITTLRYRSDGSVIPMTTTQLTQDASPPPDLQTSPPTPGVYDPRYEWWAVKPSWLPDGQHLLYVSDRPGFDPNNQQNATGAIWEQGVTDPVTNAVRLSTPVSGTGGHDSPGWRPHDPNTFIYVNYYQDQQGGDGVIEVASALTGTAPAAAATDLTPLSATEYHPVWSPDGRYIAFVEDQGHAKTNLKVMPFTVPGRYSDYARAVTVERGNPYIAQPFWSPDGKYLGYLRAGIDGNFQMVIRGVTYTRGTLRFGGPIVIPQAGAVSAEYRPTWGP